MENLERDFNLLEAITEYSCAIYGIYSLLHDEEVKHGIDTAQYAELLDLLKNTKQEEDYLYQSLELTPEKASIFSNFLIRTSSNFREYNDRILTAIKMSNPQGLVDFRMLYRFEKESYKDSEAYKKWLIEIGALESLERTENFLKYSILEDAVTSDIEKAFLYFNGESFSNPESNTKLIVNRAKYDLLFMSYDMEDALVADEDSFQEELTFTSSFVGELNQVPKEVIINTQEEEGMKVCRNAILNLITPNFIKSVRESALYYDYLKAGLSALLPLDNCDELMASLQEKLYIAERQSNGVCSDSLNGVITFIDKFKIEKPKCKWLNFSQK